MKKDAEKSFDILKQALAQTATFILHDYSKPFVQTVDCKEGFMTSVLLQTHGNKLRPIAHYSKRHDPVAQALMAATASADVVLYHPIELLVPHAVDILLLQSKMSLLSLARHLSYTAILLPQPQIHIKQCTVLNPATLFPVNTDGESHNCLEQAEQLQLPRPDLTDTPHPFGLQWFVDGSCLKTPAGKNQKGYSIVSVALTRACILAKGEDHNDTDSQYAFYTFFYFAKQWDRRGMVTSTGKPITHSVLLRDLLQAVLLPAQIAVCKFAAHTSNTDNVSNGNRLADVTAKAAAQDDYSSFDIYVSALDENNTPID